MTNRAAADERFRDLVHLDRRLNARIDALLFECVLQCERVDDRGQHAHVVGGDAVHVAGLLGDAAKKISASDDNGDLHADRVDVAEFSSYFVDAGGVNAKAFVRGEGLAGKLQQYALENWFRHAALYYRAVRLRGQKPRSWVAILKPEPLLRFKFWRSMERLNG